MFSSDLEYPGAAPGWQPGVSSGWSSSPACCWCWSPRSAEFSVARCTWHSQSLTSGIALRYRDAGALARSVLRLHPMVWGSRLVGALAGAIVAVGGTGHNLLSSPPWAVAVALGSALALLLWLFARRFDRKTDEVRPQVQASEDSAAVVPARLWSRRGFLARVAAVAGVIISVDALLGIARRVPAASASHEGFCLLMYLDCFGCCGGYTGAFPLCETCCMGCYGDCLARGAPGCAFRSCLSCWDYAS